MPHLLDEIESNFDAFQAQCKSELDATVAGLQASRSRYLASYVRLISLNCWREQFLLKTVSPPSLAFFLEAQNDALTSHVFARMGSWRAALKSLRSCIENVLFCLYFKDHPVELELWNKGFFRLGFSETLDYFLRHPQVQGIPKELTGLEVIRREYATLSRAVHGATAFRMTKTDSTKLWSCDTTDLGRWATRESRTLAALNALLTVIFAENLRGTAHRELRTAIGLAIPKRQHASLRSTLGILLPAPS